MTQLLNEKEVAATLGISVALLRKWRSGTNEGPEVTRLGSRCLYTASGVEDFIRNRTQKRG